MCHIGPEDQKGTIMGIFRSLGALSRAFGPVAASAGKYLKSLFAKTDKSIFDIFEIR